MTASSAKAKPEKPFNGGLWTAARMRSFIMSALRRAQLLKPQKMNIKPYPTNPKYLVSDTGVVFGPGRGPKSVLNPDRHVELKPTIRKGYKVIGVHWVGVGTKCISLHRMVLETFVEPRPEGFEAGHLNGNRLDNRLENLAWITQMENQHHRRIHGTLPIGEKVHSAKLTEYDVLRVPRLVSHGYSYTEIGMMMGVGRHAISRANSGRTWKHVEKQTQAA